MDAVKNKRSLMLGLPGIILQIAGMIPMHLVDPPTLASAVSAVLLLLAGTGLLVWGLALYAQSKGHSAVWCLMGFLGLIGLVVLGVLPDRTLERARAAHAGGQPDGAPPTMTADGRLITRTSSLAVWSLILGILSVPTAMCTIPGLVLGVPAIICGHMSRGAIRRTPETLTGGGMALAGLITGYVGAVLGVVIFIVMIIADMSADAPPAW